MAQEAAKSNVQGALIALLTMAVYATHDVIIKYLGAYYSPFQILFFAVFFSFPLVTVVLMQDKTEGNLRPKYPKWSVIRTASAVINGFTVFYAFTHLPLAEVYAIIFTAPLLITVLSIPILGEKVRLRRWAAVVVGLIGVMIVLQPGKSDLSLGHLAALTGACFSALNAVIVRKIGKEERSAVLMIYPMVANFVVMGALLPFVYKPVEGVHLAASAGMALLGVTAGFLFIAAYRRAEAVVVAPMQYSQIIWATMFGVLLFDEQLKTNVVIGAGVIIASGLYILFRESSSKASANTPVLDSMDFGRDKGTSPRSTLLMKFRSEAAKVTKKS
jgi:S-adenosylmethionine uptake transporter